MENARPELQYERKPKAGFRLLFWLICFWTGAAIMACELTGARLLMPAFGVGIEVWAAVIAVTLGALSIGYFIGGKLGDARPSMLTLAIVLFITFCFLFFEHIFGRSLSGMFTNSSLVAGAIYSSIFILAPPILLLGMVPPMLSRLLIANTRHSGTTVGAVLAVGTIGSVCGTILTGLYFLPRFGVSKTMIIIFTGTAILTFTSLISCRSWKTAATILLIFITAFFGTKYLQPYSKPVGPMQILEEHEGLYGHLEVLEYRGQRALLCNGIFQTVIPVSGFGILKGTLLRSRDYTELLPYFRSDARTALLIGLGGGLYDRVLSMYGFETESVEIEPAVIELAGKYFGFAGKAFVGDGRFFLTRNPKKYDVIIIDAFLGGSVPEHLFTKESFELYREHLNTDGVLALHLAGHPNHIAIRAVAKTVQSVLPNLSIARSGIADETQHIFLFASDKELQINPGQRLELENCGFTGQELVKIETNDVPLLTDDRTSLNFLSRDIAAEHRRNALQIRKKPLW